MSVPFSTFEREDRRAVRSADWLKVCGMMMGVVVYSGEGEGDGRFIFVERWVGGVCNMVVVVFGCERNFDCWFLMIFTS